MIFRHCRFGIMSCDPYEYDIELRKAEKKCKPKKLRRVHQAIEDVPISHCPSFDDSKRRVLAVIYTDVIATAAAFPKGLCAKVIDKIKEGYIVPVYDGSLLRKYIRILDDPKVEKLLNKSAKRDAVYEIIKNGILTDSVEGLVKRFLDMDNDFFFDISERKSGMAYTALSVVHGINCCVDKHKFKDYQDWFKKWVEEIKRV